MTTPRPLDAFVAQVREIADMAEDLRARGLVSESLAFALIAARWLQAARALEAGRRALKEPQP